MSKEYEDKKPIEFFTFSLRPQDGGGPMSYRADIPLKEGGRRIVAETYTRIKDKHYVIFLQTGPLASHEPPRGVETRVLGVADDNLESKLKATKKAYESVRKIVEETARKEGRRIIYPEYPGC